MSAEAGDAGLVHGLAGDLVAPDWPPLTDEEARWVGERWSLPWASERPDEAGVLWRSPRPLSAAGVVGVPGTAVFVKRHDLSVRDPQSLGREHRFAQHLRAEGLEAPELLQTPDGLSAVVGERPTGPALYEVHAVAPGADLYRDAESWTGFLTRDHARAAGALLARLHLVACDLELDARPFGPLVDSDEIVTAADPLAALAALVDARPGLAAGLAPRPWRREIGEALGPWLAETSRQAGRLPRAWTHGDWHPSNLTWSADGAPVAVLDLGLSNRTTPVRDLAIALERSCVSWLEPAPAADFDTVGALLGGYTAVRRLSAAEWEALPALTATAHVEFALSEVEYYAAVLSSPERAEIAYRDYLIGHARWFATAAGRSLLDALSAGPRA
ncbi:MAG TPA: phosphotransferase [Solirubrobacteraceae bacterium]|jgi:Ser/Thr protein kinase RdoA (MazF antagonist)